MNYSKSLSELLFEEKSFLTEDANSVDALEIEDIKKLATFLVDINDLDKFKQAVKNGQTNILSQFLMSSSKVKSNQQSKPEDIKKNTSAKDVDGLELGDKIINIKFTDLRNRITSKLADEFKPLVLDDDINADLATLNNAQKKKNATLGVGPAKISYLNIVGEDKLVSSGRDVKEYDDIGHAFFMLIGPDPEDGKKAAYFSNGGKIIIFAHPTRKILVGKAREIHEKIFNVTIVEDFSLKNDLIHEQSISSFLFEQGAAAGESTARNIKLPSKNDLEEKIRKVRNKEASDFNNDEKQEIKNLISDLKKYSMFFDNDDDLEEKMKYLQGLVIPETDPPAQIDPPSAEMNDDYDDKIEAETMEKYLGAYKDDAGLSDKALKVKDFSLGQKRAYLKNKVSSVHSDNILDAFNKKNPDKSKEYNLKIEYIPLNQKEPRSFTATAYFNKKEKKWKVKFDKKVTINENFVHRLGLKALLEQSDDSAETQFFNEVPGEDDSLARVLDDLGQTFSDGDDIDLLELGEQLSFSVIKSVDVTDKKEGTGEEAEEASAEREDEESIQPAPQPEPAEEEDDNVDDVLQSTDISPKNDPVPPAEENLQDAPEPEPDEESLQGTPPESAEIPENEFNNDGIGRIYNFFYGIAKSYSEKFIYFVENEQIDFRKDSYLILINKDSTVKCMFQGKNQENYVNVNNPIETILNNNLKYIYMLDSRSSNNPISASEIKNLLKKVITPSLTPAPEPDPEANLQQGTGQSGTSTSDVSGEAAKVFDNEIEIEKRYNINNDTSQNDFNEIYDTILNKIEENSDLFAVFFLDDDNWTFIYDVSDGKHKLFASSEEVLSKILNTREFLYANRYFTYGIREKSKLPNIFSSPTAEDGPSQGGEESQGEQEASQESPQGEQEVEASSTPPQKRGNVRDLDRLFSITPEENEPIDIKIYFRDSNKKLCSFEAQLISDKNSDETDVSSVTKILYKLDNNDELKYDVLQEAIYKQSLSRLLFEQEDESNNKTETLTLEELKSRFESNNFEFDSAQVEDFENLNKRETDADVKAKNFKSTMEKILYKFNVKDGLGDIKYENIKVLKEIEDILRNGGTKELKKQYPNGFNMADIVESIDAELQANEITEFVTDFVGFIYENKYKKSIDNLVNDFRASRITEKNIQSFLQDYFNLNDLVLESKRGSNKVLLNEFSMGDIIIGAGGTAGDSLGKFIFSFLSNLFTSSIWGYIILGIILIVAGFKISSKIYETTLGKKLGKMFAKKLEDSKMVKKTLSAISDNNELRTELNKQLKNFVSFLICSYCKKKFDIEFSATGDSVKKSGDFKFTGDFAQDMNAALTSEIQSALFTQTFRDSAKQEAGRDLSDDELLQSYEAMLDDMVMSFMQDIQKSEYADVQSERDKLAYDSEMDKKDAGVFAGVAAFPASMAIASTLAPATGGLSLLAIGFAGALMGGIGAEAIVKAKGVKRGPKEQEFMRNSEKDKLTIRNVVIMLAKKELNIKESYGLSDDFIYMAGLTLLKEGLLEAEGEEVQGEESEVAAEESGEEKKREEPEIRGQISWNVISRKLTSNNFFLFKPTYTRAVGKQAAAEAQYDFGSHLAALTEECFGLRITDVDKIDIRDAQALTVTQMMVNQNAAMGEGSLPHARTKGLNGKGMNDPITMEEFGHLLNQCDGDTTKVILYLMMNGRLDSFLNALKGGKNTPEGIFNYLGGMIEGENFPGSMSASKQKAIENVNSSEWIKNLLKYGKINSPIKIIYKGLNEDELKSLVERIEETLVTFSQGYTDQTQQNPSLDSHNLLLSKGQKIDEVDTSDFYSFNCGQVGARKIIDEQGDFIDGKEDESSKNQDFLVKVKIDTVHQAFKGFDFSIDSAKDFNQVVDDLAKKISVILILRTMFSNKPGPYHRKHTKSENVEPVTKKEYSVSVIRAIMGKKIELAGNEFAGSSEIVDNNKIKKAFTESRVSSFYEEHLDLYRLWKVR